MTSPIAAVTGASGSAQPGPRPPKTATIVYIDGFNFFYGVIKDTSHKWLDIQKFFTKLRADDDIRRIHYFTALVNGTGRAEQDTYLRALRTLPLVNVVLGRYKSKNVSCQVGCGFRGNRMFTVPEEKRSDVNLAIQMVDDAHLGLCDRFIVVSGDSDLVPAVARVKELGKEVLVYVPARDDARAFAAELRDAATRDKTLPLSLLQHAHFPDEVPDGAGAVIRKPATW